MSWADFQDLERRANGFVLMIIASALACVVPAWRAMRADPLNALRG
jgi:ABC-type lipoprotein release transport system permease subunit